MALKFEIPVQTNLLSAVSELVVIKFYETQRVKVEFGIGVPFHNVSCNLS